MVSLNLYSSLVIGINKNLLGDFMYCNHDQVIEEYMVIVILFPV